MPDEPLKTDTDKSPLPIEETPIIDPASGEVAEETGAVSQPQPEEARDEVVSEAARVFQGTPETQAQAPYSAPVSVSRESKKSGGNKIGMVLFIVLLFGLGVWLSSQLRSFFTPSVSDELVVPTLSPSANTGPVSVSESSSSAIAPVSDWQTYDVISGATKKPIPGLTYKLPTTVKAPVCDSQSCASSGTNLPGGTRFTVAARGKGQLLPDFRGAILTDASGREFTMKQGVFGGAYAYEYTGNFNGRTGGGYTFTAMRGVLMPVSETLAIEFNHFAPAGITSDFAKDDALFDEIIKSFTVQGTSTGTPAAQPTFGIPTSTPVATTSGS